MLRALLRCWPRSPKWAEPSSAKSSALRSFRPEQLHARQNCECALAGEPQLPGGALASFEIRCERLPKDEHSEARFCNHQYCERHASHDQSRRQTGNNVIAADEQRRGDPRDRQQERQLGNDGRHFADRGHKHQVAKNAKTQRLWETPLRNKPVRPQSMIRWNQDCPPWVFCMADSPSIASPYCATGLCQAKQPKTFRRKDRGFVGP